jgi:hypothetical protein
VKRSRGRGAAEVGETRSRWVEESRWDGERDDTRRHATELVGLLRRLAPLSWA